ncbi:hypothetical protein Sros01_78380 [Streptomyces roseochromogenus]|nr:hypothetical protein Sros01_78380 [Streptomyces roseochromogenus]
MGRPGAMLRPADPPAYEGELVVHVAQEPHHGVQFGRAEAGSCGIEAASLWAGSVIQAGTAKACWGSPVV